MTLQVKYIFKLDSNPKTTFVAPLNFVQNLKIIFIRGQELDLKFLPPNKSNESSSFPFVTFGLVRLLACFNFWSLFLKEIIFNLPFGSENHVCHIVGWITTTDCDWLAPPNDKVIYQSDLFKVLSIEILFKRSDSPTLGWFRGISIKTSLVA